MGLGCDMPNQHLPTKICEICKRPFAWRRKWARDWERVRYCSKRCQREAKRHRTTSDGSADTSQQGLH